jgi:segregation and condensation protein B
MPANEQEVSDESSSPAPEQRLVEAMLFLGGPPLTAARAGEAVRGLTPAGLAEAVEALNHAYRTQGRPYLIRVRDQGYELILRPRFGRVIDRLAGSPREARLSQQGLDVLALVAYRQPVTRSEVEALRGADSAGPLRQLIRLGLVALQRGGGEDGREVSYSTTARFLTLFSLRSLDDLPRTQDLQLM